MLKFGKSSGLSTKNHCCWAFVLLLCVCFQFSADRAFAQTVANYSTIVYSEIPSASAAATSVDGYTYTIDTTATSAKVVDGYTGSFDYERGLMEFGLSSIPSGATIEWATIDVDVNRLQGTPTEHPDLDIMGYVGDGVITAADVNVLGTLIGTSGELEMVGSYSWSIDKDYVASFLGTHSHIGLRIEPGTNTGLRAGFTLKSDFFPQSIPRLVIGYSVPEPATLSLLVLGGLALIRRR